MKRLLGIVTTVGLALLISVSAFAGGSQEEQQETGGFKDRIVVGRTSEGVAFDPYESIDTSTLEVCVQIYDTLVTMDDNMEIVPMLAEDWESIDDTALRINLKEGVKFHNGDELTAEDVKFSIDRISTSSAAGYIFKFLDSVEIEDDYTVVFNTEEPFAPILAHLSHPAASILNKTYVEELGDEYGRSPVGTGGYKFVEWRQGDSVTLEAFEDHFRGKTPTQELVFRAIPEASQRTIGLETGELDIAYDIHPTGIETLNEYDNITVENVPGLRYFYLGLNTRKEPFGDVKVRQAIAHAVNKEVIANQVYEGTVSPATSPVPPLSFGASSDVPDYDYDLDKAKDLLEEAGYADGFETSVWVRDDQSLIETAQVIQDGLKQIGIDMSIEVMEWGAFLEKTANGEQEMYLLGWTNVTGDAHYIAYGLYSSEQFGVAGNRAFYKNERVDELLAKSVSTTDQDQREKYYAEVQKIVMEEIPLVSLYYKNIILAYNDNVEGFAPSPTSYHKLYGVKVER